MDGLRRALGDEALFSYLIVTLQEKRRGEEKRRREEERRGEERRRLQLATIGEREPKR